ncbi:hypothetical protein KFK09_003395 [Dendrobium nobile]|uniref:Uncharacterized protein n=1 Tax=Dendrobium nobile TaxID=94219 RepID=A0A8T3C316_DENNO|nr:hypothetical protein KFK09_003395 [Dendrobium nobile]
MINQLLEIEHGKLEHAHTKKERLDDSGYDSISDEEKDARSRLPFTYAATKAKRGGYNNLEKEKQEVCEWSAILGEANELAGLHGKTCNSFSPSVVLEERRSHKGGRGNSRFKFSFRSLSNKEDFSGDHSLSRDETYNSCEEDIEGPAKWDYFEHGAEEDTVPQLMENILEESVDQANKPEFHKQLAGAPSVSELLEDLQKTDPSLRRTLAVDNSKGKARRTSSSKRTLMCLGNRVLDNKDASESMGDISSDDEHIDQDYQAFQIKGQTMADLFQEAFNTSVEEGTGIPRSNKFGLHGRLQHVMQLGNNRYMEYLKELQTGRTPSNESNHIIVRILSRTFEAKLTVCQCFFGENSKNFQCEKGFHEGFENGGSGTKTIIFSPTFCSNVELEVGSIVCIHQPWKEFQINGGETIILSAYFSSCL